MCRICGIWRWKLSGGRMMCVRDHQETCALEIIVGSVRWRPSGNGVRPMYTTIKGIHASQWGGSFVAPQWMSIGSAGSNIHGRTRKITREERQLGQSHGSTSVAFDTRRPRQSRIYDARRRLNFSGRENNAPAWLGVLQSGSRTLKCVLCWLHSRGCCLA